MTPTIAVLHQAIEPPTVYGVRKPKKPGGYQDSSADIAFALSQQGFDVVTPELQPTPEGDEGWSFPDTEQGILSAIQRGATHLWANTVLFAAHPLQSSSALDKYASCIYVIGQPPCLVDLYDDKNYVNELLRHDGTLDLPKSWTVSTTDDAILLQLKFPVVGKPIRGRGSHGVKVCWNRNQLVAHLTQLLAESPQVMLEEYLAGQEGTITVMPPSAEHHDYWSLPMVVRYNHQDGVAPYNGVVAVTANSRLVTDRELFSSTAYQIACRQCEKVAKILRVTAAIRIDVRRYSDATDARFALFDVNMKPENMTGPGRPGREDQASLTAMAAKKLGWTYPELLAYMLASAQTLVHIRDMRIPEQVRVQHNFGHSRVI